MSLHDHIGIVRSRESLIAIDIDYDYTNTDTYENCPKDDNDDNDNGNYNDMVTKTRVGSGDGSGGEDTIIETTITTAILSNHHHRHQQQKQSPQSLLLPPPPSKALYISHAISTWNSRGFEFGAVLFLASIYPGTLLPMSIYALVRALAAVVLAPWIGRFIDSHGRLGVVRVSILGQRLSVVCSCALFWVLLLMTTDPKLSLGSSSSSSSRRSAITIVEEEEADKNNDNNYNDNVSTFWHLLEYAIFVGMVLLACVEKLCSIMNTVSVERDWVVVIAGERDHYLQKMNSQMRRIDLFCKLVSPLAVALLDGISSKVAILATFTINAVFVGTEYLLIARVYRLTPALAGQRRTSSASSDAMDSDENSASFELDTNPNTASSLTQKRSTAPSVIADLQAYIRSPAVMPSLSLSILYLTVLSFSGQMTTYLLAVPSPQLDSTSVGILRTVSTIFEMSSTFLAPKLISSIGAVRAGIWCISWQALCLTSGVGLLFGSSSEVLPKFFVRDGISNVADSKVGVIALIVSVMLSRMGLWSFDLVAQLLIQNSINSDHRGSFSSVEASLQNLFELCTFATTIIWSKPEQFKYPALVSLIAVFTAGACYATFVRNRRGHLIHFPPCFDLPWTSVRKLSLRRRSYAVLSEVGESEDIAMTSRRSST